MCSKYAKYGLGIAVLALAGLVMGAVLSTFGFVGLWWNFPGEWEELRGLSGQPQELLALRVPEGAYLLKTSSGELFSCEEGGGCTPSSVDWSGEPNVRNCNATTRLWTTHLLRPALNWTARVVLGCEVGYQATGRNVFILHDVIGRTYATHGAVFLPTDMGMVLIGLAGGLVGLLIGGGVGLVIALVLLARNKKRDEIRAAP